MHREPIVPCLMPVDDTVRMVVPLLFQSVILTVLPRRHSHRPSPSVILASRRESRLVFPTEELDSRARLENDGGGRGWEGRAWIPGEAPRMTAKKTHGTENDGLDSRARIENDGNRKTPREWPSPSPSSFSPAGGNPGWCFPLKNWIPEQGSRMTEGGGNACHASGACAMSDVG